MMKKISTATISFLMHLPSSRVGSDGARVVAPSSLTTFPPLLFQEIDKTDDGFGKFDNEESCGPEPTLDPNEVQTAVPCGSKRHADPMIV
jgi:hypothetical protein